MNLTSPWGECRINGLSTETLRQNLVDEIKQRHAEGRIITLMWHCCFPSECNDCDGASIWTWQNRRRTRFGKNSRPKGHDSIRSGKNRWTLLYPISNNCVMQASRSFGARITK